MQKPIHIYATKDQFCMSCQDRMTFDNIDNVKYNLDFMDQEILFQRIVVGTSGKPYHGKVSGNKLTLLCPYCQANEKGVKARDAASAILPKENNGWRFWVFNCLRCNTKHRIDKFPVGLFLPTDKDTLNHISTPIHTPRKNEVQRLPTEPITVQLGKGAWLDYKLNRHKQMKRPWWEKGL